MNLDLIEKPLLRQSGRAALDGPSRFLLVAMGLLPFISTVKLPPLPSFWAEWIAACLAVALLGVAKLGCGLTSYITICVTSDTVRRVQGG